MSRPLACAEVGVRRLVCDIDQVGKSEVLHLPSAAPVPRIVPFAVETVLGHPQVEIFRHHAGIKLGLIFAAGRGGFIESGNVKGPVVHDVVEVDADAEAVRRFHHVLQVGLGAVTRADRVALVLLPEVERIPHVVADRKAAGSLGRWRKPKRTVARLGQLGHFAGDLGVRDVEELKQPLGACGGEQTPC